MNSYAVYPLLASSASYLSAAVLAGWHLFGRSGRGGRATIAAAGIGAAATAAGLAVHALQTGRWPAAGLFESMALFALFLGVIYLAVVPRPQAVALGAFAAPMAFAAVTVAAAAAVKGSPPLPPALQSKWLAIHVPLTLSAYAAFALAFCCGAIYLVHDRLLRGKHVLGAGSRLLSLDGAENLAYRLVAFGFPLLAMGIITGAAWAQQAWGKFWQWDPKETWALITWLVFAAYLHARTISGWRGRRTSYLLVFGFLSLVATYLGVGLSGVGLHASPAFHLQ